VPAIAPLPSAARRLRRARRSAGEIAAQRGGVDRKKCATGRLRRAEVVNDGMSASPADAACAASASTRLATSRWSSGIRRRSRAEVERDLLVARRPVWSRRPASPTARPAGARRSCERPRRRPTRTPVRAGLIQQRRERGVDPRRVLGVRTPAFRSLAPTPGFGHVVFEQPAIETERCADSNAAASGAVSKRRTKD